MSEREIFSAAVRIEDSAQRAAYLGQVCGADVALRQRLDHLLHAHFQASSFLDKPALEQVAAESARTDALDSPTHLRKAVHPEAAETQAEPSRDADASLDFLTPSQKPGSLGRLGHYEIMEILGKGGFGTVFKAFDEKLHRVVAIKVLAPELAASGTAKQRFLREARTAASVRHEHIIDIHAVVDEGPIPYLVMEYIEGQTLQDKLDKSGPLEVKEILRIGYQIADGLKSAHKQGLIHRDIKPGNVMLENGVERVKITDFGLARAVDDASVTQSGVVAGTPMYMSPEQANGESLDHRTDLFSLGTVMYAMCTGRPPFRASGTLAVLKRVAEDSPRPIREINGEIPQWLCDIIDKLHAKKREERYQSAREVADLLAKYLSQIQLHGGVVHPALTQPGSLVSASRVALASPVALVPGGLASEHTEDLSPPTGASNPGAPGQPRPPGRLLRFAVGFGTLAVILALAYWLEPHLTLLVRNEGYLWISSKKGVGVHWVLLTKDGTVVKDIAGLGFQGFNIAPGEYVLKATNLKPGTTCRFESAMKTLFSYKAEVIPFIDHLAFAVARGERVNIEVEVVPLEGKDRPSPPTQAAPLPLALAPFDASKAKEHQEAWAKHLGVDVEIKNSIGMKLRLIPPGEFTMGSSPAEIDWILTKAPELKDEAWAFEEFRSEGPDRRVSIRKPFLLGSHEITVGQFREFIEATKHRTWAELNGGGLSWNSQTSKFEQKPENVWNNPRKSGSEAHPVAFVNLDDAKAFCAWLSPKDGRNYSVPTEEQWEYACRAGTDTRWFFGDESALMKKYGWTSPHSGGEKQPVGRLDPNPFGILDLYGNVFEWTVTPQGQLVGRGGEAGFSAMWARSASRIMHKKPEEALQSRGFRVAASTDLPPLAVAPFDAAKAKEHQEAWAKHLGVDVEIKNSIGMKLRLIPPGEFLMGYTKEQRDRVLPEMTEKWAADYVKSSNAKQIRVPELFRLGVHEVTVGQFRRFVEAKKYRTTAERDGKGGAMFDYELNKYAHKPELIWSYRFPWSTDEDPVTFVTPEDAEVFCAWLSEIDGQKYALPRGEQWEYACRAGTSTLWWTGDRKDDVLLQEQLERGPKLHKVGSLGANPFGLLDMHGNASEWVRAPNRFEHRGASPGNLARLSHSAFRASVEGDIARWGAGFRVAIVGDLKGKTPPADQWVQLFNGKDINGWKPPEKHPNNWKIENGILVGRSPTSYLFRDGVGRKPFHLRAATRINNGGYGAIVAHTGPELRDDGSAFGCWASINSTNAARKTGSLNCTYMNYQVDPGLQKQPPAPNEWVLLEIISQEDLLTVKVNGATTAVAQLGAWARAYDYIALCVGNDKSVIEFRKIEIKELRPTTTVETSQPFVLLAKAKAERKLATLAEATAAAQSGDTIEIRGDGPFDTGTINIKSKALAIRAGKDCRPVIKFKAESKQPTKADYLMTDSALVLEGLEFQRLREDTGELGIESPAMIGVNRAPLHVANCRFVTNFWDLALNSLGSPRFEVRNCLFVRTVGGSDLAWQPVSGGQMIVENCVAAPRDSWLFFRCQDPNGLENVSIRLTKNSVANTADIFLVHFYLEKMIQPASTPPIVLEASGNVFDIPSALGFVHNKASSLSSAEMEVLLPHMLAWRERKNLYSTRAERFLCLQAKNQNNILKELAPTRGKDLTDWKHFWGTPQADSIRDRIKYQGGDLLAKWGKTPGQITPEDFRLADGSPGKKADKNGKDLGADVDLVGPGPAYEKWKKTAEYGEWWKKVEKSLSGKR